MPMPHANANTNATTNANTNANANAISNTLFKIRAWLEICSRSSKPMCLRSSNTRSTKSASGSQLRWLGSRTSKLGQGGLEDCCRCLETSRSESESFFFNAFSYFQIDLDPFEDPSFTCTHSQFVLLVSLLKQTKSKSISNLFADADSDADTELDTSIVSHRVCK